MWVLFAPGDAGGICIRTDYYCWNRFRNSIVSTCEPYFCSESLSGKTVRQQRVVLQLHACCATLLWQECRIYIVCHQWGHITAGTTTTFSFYLTSLVLTVDSTLVASFFPGQPLPLDSLTVFVRDVWHIFCAGCPSRHPTNSVKALKETQSSDPNQWPGLILGLPICLQLLLGFPQANLSGCVKPVIYTPVIIPVAMQYR